MENEDDNSNAGNVENNSNGITEKEVEEQKVIADNRRRLLDDIFATASRTISIVSDEATDNQAIASTYVDLLSSAINNFAGKSGDALQRENEGFLTKLAEMFSGAVYYKRVSDLAASMARAKEETATGYGTNYDFWLSAERHIRDLVHGVVDVNRSSVESVYNSVAKMFEGYSPERHLDRVRQRAFEIYQHSGRSRSALDNWLEAEEEMRSQLRREGSSQISD